MQVVFDTDMTIGTFKLDTLKLSGHIFLTNQLLIKQ